MLTNDRLRADDALIGDIGRIISRHAHSTPEPDGIPPREHDPVPEESPLPSPAPVEEPMPPMSPIKTA